MSRVKLVHYRRFLRGPDFSTSAVFRSAAASDARTITSRVTSCLFQETDQDEGRSSPSRLHGGLHRRFRYVYHWALVAQDRRGYRHRRRSDSGASPMAIEQRARTKDRPRPSSYDQRRRVNLWMEMDEAVGVNCVAAMAIGGSCRLRMMAHVVMKEVESSCVLGAIGQCSKLALFGVGCLSPRPRAA